MHTHIYHKPLHIVVPVVCSIKLHRNKKKKKKYYTLVMQIHKTLSISDLYIPIIYRFNIRLFLDMNKY